MAKKKTAKTLKQIALEDMRAAGVSTMVFSIEVAILEYTRNPNDEDYHRRDFRQYNGIPHRYNKKR